jgi:tRNA A37 threonylcarbamoyladenosine synthetase subunit TsaC/SUA5/YrdC
VRQASAGPITATSLNASGAPPARARAQAEALCGALPDQPRLLDVKGAECGGDAASTVVDVTGARPLVLRWGAIPADALEPVLAEVGGA